MAVVFIDNCKLHQLRPNYLLKSIIFAAITSSSVMLNIQKKKSDKIIKSRYRSTINVLVFRGTFMQGSKLCINEQKLTTIFVICLWSH